MIKLSNLILEKFELPADLQKQLENTGYSALGHILTPYIERFRKKLFSNKALNDKSYAGLKNVFDTIRSTTKGIGGNTKLTFTDVLVPEYFGVTTASIQMKKIKVIIEKGYEDIYIKTEGDKTKLFPRFSVSKDSAGWDLGYLNREWNQFKSSYDDMLKEFDEKLVLTENLKMKLESWKILDKAKKPKIHPGGQKMALVYEKDFVLGDKYRHYDHYFRVMPSRKVDTHDQPDYFSGAIRPFIIQTIYLDEFNPDTNSLGFFMDYVNKFIGTSRHEGRHLIQHYGNINKKLKGDFTVVPKKD
jgi:hypothetical protein